MVRFQGGKLSSSISSSSITGTFNVQSGWQDHRRHDQRIKEQVTIGVQQNGLLVLVAVIAIGEQIPAVAVDRPVFEIAVMKSSFSNASHSD